MASLSGWWSALKRRFRGQIVSSPTPAPPRAAYLSPPPLLTPPVVRGSLPLAPQRRRRPATLALQGGGAHGAFTWGVLDGLLADGRFMFTAVSGASAGAMNGAMLLQGLARGGADGAREQLEQFWRQVSGAGARGKAATSAFGRKAGSWNIDSSFATHWYEYAKRWVAPYDIQPEAYNPLRGLLAEMLDLPTLRAADADFYVSATDVRAGRLRIFETDEIDVETLLASACLPHVFQAVQIDGRDYWDGGYLANPALQPLIDRHGDADLILVTIDPFTCPETPRRPSAIGARLVEIAMNAPLMRELQDLRAGRIRGAERLRLHHIQADDALRGLGHYSKMSSDWGFLTWLRDAGRDAALQWLARCGDRVGVESTLDDAA